MGKRKCSSRSFPSKPRKRSRAAKAARLRQKNKSAESTYGEQLNLPGPSKLQKQPSSSSSEEIIPAAEIRDLPMEPIHVTPLPFTAEDVRNQPLEPLHVTPLPGSSKNIETTMEKSSPDISFISDEHYQSVMEHELSLEVDTTPQQQVISGNRIVDINYVLKWAIPLQYNHSKICTNGKIYLKEEDRWGSGLVSILKFGCDMCTKTYEYSTEDPSKSKSKINYGLVWGTLASGSTYGHTKELLCSMDIPPLTLYMFKKIEEELGEVWKDELYKNMEQAGKEEYEEAIRNNQIDGDGIPFITVYLDGGWSKRSYGHSYRASSGLAVIIGQHSKKLLFLGVRNKYCSICARAANKNIPPGEHRCFRNWSGSSPAMEADIVVEGFKKSIEMHRVRYKKFIADGDSSVYAKIREKVSYGMQVEKVECVNHAIKNYGKALYQIKNSKDISLEVRNLLTKKKIEELEKYAQNSIYSNAHGDIEQLKVDLSNGPNHVYGDHQKCSLYLCKTPGSFNKEFEKTKCSGLYLHIKGALELLLRKSHKLIDNETNNRAEIFMAINARFNQGKRLNLVQRGSYEMRSHLTGLRYNKGSDWHYSPWKNFFGESPGEHFKKFLITERQMAGVKRNVKRDLSQSKKGKENLPNIDYGPKATEPELSSEEMKSECNRILKDLQITPEEQEEISEKTVGQFDNLYYIQLRKHRLTASQFGRIINKLPHTSCHNIVKDILYGSAINTVAMEFGKTRENIVKLRFSEEQNVNVMDCGLFIDINRGYLGASPDGLIGDEHIIEIKCLYKISKENITLDAAMGKYKNLCLKRDKDGEVHLKRNHPYYYQVQGQLNITQRTMCYFVVYTGDNNPLFIEKIYKDNNLWTEKMIPKLEQFYVECVLPEIVRKNIPRGLKCVEPLSVIEAQEKQRNK